MMKNKEQVFTNITPRKVVVFHAITWLVLAFFALSNDSYMIDLKDLNLPLFYRTFIIVNVVGFYFHYFLMGKIISRGQTLVRYGLVLLLSFTFFISFRYLLEEVIIYNISGIRNYNEVGLRFYIIDNIFYFLRPTVLSSLLFLFIYNLKLLDINNRVLSEKKSAEIMYLKSQINPHFVFNTLNNLYSMVYFKSPKALGVIEKLSNIMRFTTYEIQKHEITLGEEITYLESYVELEEYRHGKGQLVTIEKNIENDQVMIMPYMLSPLVENAMKHGTFSAEKPVKLYIELRNDILIFTISNHFSKSSNKSTGGFGLENLRSRLDLKYPDSYELLLSQEEDRFKVEMKVEL